MKIRANRSNQFRNAAATFLLAALISATAQAQTKPIRVAADGSADYKTVQAAVDHLPAEGGTISIAPGTYREQVIINQSHVTLFSPGSDPTKTVIVDDTSQGTRGTKASYATVHVLGDDFHALNITFENDFNRTHVQASAGSQAQALNVEGDRNILANVRILGNQDTLYIGAKRCGQAGNLRSPAPATGLAPGAPPPPTPPTAYTSPASAQNPCTPIPTRTYFTHCYIAGNVDFIYGDGNALFDDCEIHSTVHDAGGYLTAQGKFRADQQSAFVFDHCRLTADPGQKDVWLARPWRPYATVIYLNTEMGAHIVPAGWREWHPGDTKYLDTAYYAEYKSTGPGANPQARVPQSHQLTAEEAKKYEPAAFLAGPDHWNPEAEAKQMAKKLK
jgi:pectin methylesterase-like acyl-CoA thioesterase